MQFVDQGAQDHGPGRTEWVAAITVRNLPDEVHRSLCARAALNGRSTEEEVLAVVVAKEGFTVDPVALLDFCQGRMAHFAVPRYVRIVATLPRTPSQRVEKYKLRSEGVTTDTWDRESIGYEVKR